MAFEFRRKSNLQDNFERMATETLTDVILEYYDVDSLSDLSEEKSSRDFCCSLRRR